MYVNEIRAKGGIPVFVTSVNLNLWNGTQFNDASLADYPDAFNNYPMGEYPNYPNGNKDQTHFREMGAIEVSRLVVEGIKGLASSNPSLNALIPYLKPVYEVEVTANPKASATSFTRTASYHSSMSITLKSIPKTSGTFVKWNDENNKQVGTSALYKFTMGTKLLLTPPFTKALSSLISKELKRRI